MGIPVGRYMERHGDACGRKKRIRDKGVSGKRGFVFCEKDLREGSVRLRR